MKLDLFSSINSIYITFTITTYNTYNVMESKNKEKYGYIRYSNLQKKCFFHKKLGY